MTTITDNAVPATGRSTTDEMIAFVIMAALLAIVPLTGLYPYFVMQALCFALFACAFNLLIGYSGLLSFGHAMFLGTAGYVTAHALKVWGVSPEIGIILGVIGACALSVITGLIAIRRQGIYFRDDHAGAVPASVLHLPANPVHPRRGWHPGHSAGPDVRYPRPVEHDDALLRRAGGVPARLPADLPGHQLAVRARC